jgi:hypothetical protein
MAAFSGVAEGRAGAVGAVSSSASAGGVWLLAQFPAPLSGAPITDFAEKEP